ncbi:MAG: hypothetical protein WD530_05175, partial [Vicingaceae bacterium]
MRSLVFTAIITILLACNSVEKKEFSQINEKVDFKYIQFGEGGSAEPGQQLMLNLVITDTLNDTLHYVPNYSYFIPLKNSALDSAWMQMKVGDSACFRLSRSYFNKRF